MFRRLTAALFGGKVTDKIAKNRLQMVLVQDRSGLSSAEMDNFRKDLMDVIARYFVLETDTVEIDWERHDSCVALVINTPVMGRSSVPAPKPVAVEAAVDANEEPREAANT